MIRKIIAGLLAATMIMGASVPVMAEGQVFVNFLANGQNTGKYVAAGSNVTAPAAPLVGGFTFCGYDKSLKNVTTNTTYTAIYVSNALGEDAIKAKKASLPTPAITATTVADPNAPMTTLAAVGTAVPAPTATAPAATTASGNAAAALPAAIPANAQQVALSALAQAQQAATAAGVDTKAVQNVATQATQAAAQAATEAAAASGVDTKAVQNVAAQAVNQAANVLPSWAVSLHGVDAKGAAEVYKYWKTVKQADDATIQSNWDALLNHYAGHGTQGW